MKSVTTHEAKTHLSRLISEVEGGEEVIICRGKEPAAKLVSAKKVEEKPRRPKVRTLTSEKVTYSNDCFEPLSDKELEDWGIN